MSVTAVKPGAGIQFTETMRGFFAQGAHGDYEAAAAEGQKASSPFEFTLTVDIDDLDAMLSDPKHRGTMTGSATAKALSDAPMAVRDGEFELFVSNPNGVETRNMNYRMKMTAANGREYFMTGFKVVHPNPVTDVWHDTSTLYISVFDGPNDSGAELGRGVLHILPADFAKQMTTLQVTNGASPEDRLRTIAKFGQFFTNTLFDSYGGVFARESILDPDAPPRQKRPLKVSAPEVYSFAAADGVPLRLTRYQGGPKGPVILSHGLGVSSRIFSTDTIDTNLLEYLFAHGYDVWLLDFRDSIALPASSQEWTGDDVATKDYPTAVNKVREITEAKDVQMVVHCWGSTTFFMAMLAGLEGVRSVVCSQVATHVVAPPLTKLKTGMHLPEVLDGLGIESLTAYVDTHADWWNKLYDDALRVYPVAGNNLCNSAVCHRISFMYAPLYEHAQLNDATHSTLHEMFGVANIRSFEQIGLITRTGHIVAADGTEAYLPHLKRLAVPILFIHGAANQCFLPESTEATYNLLRETNGDALYSRKVIPNYGHIDCIFGKNAAKDVYPLMAQHLDATATAH